jgi:peptide/nickel transport system permease protein
LTLFGISLVIFLIGFTTQDLPNLILGPRITQESREALTAQLGLNEPLHVQYLRWVERLLQGDLGMSFAGRRPVSDFLGERMIPSLELAILALVVALTIIIGMARFRRRAGGSVRVLEVGFAAVPDFWLALILVLILGVSLRLLPLGGRCSPTLTGSDCPQLEYLVMPVFVLAAATIGAAVRGARTILADRKDHDLRRGMAFISSALPGLVSSLIIVETVFAWPGIGRITVQAAIQLDFWVILSSIMILAASVVFAQTLFNIVSVFLFGVAAERRMKHEGAHDFITSTIRFSSHKSAILERQAAAKPRIPSGKSTFSTVSQRKLILERLRIEPTSMKASRKNARGQTGFQGISRYEDRQHSFQPIQLMPVAMAVLIMIVLASALAPVITEAVLQVDADRTNITERFLPIGASGHPLGTDHLGRDVLVRLIYAGQASLGIGLAGGMIALVVGGLVGMAAYNGWSRPVVWLAEAFRAIPILPLLLLIVMTRRPELAVMVVVLGLVSAVDVTLWIIVQSAPNKRSANLSQTDVRHPQFDIRPLILPAVVISMGNVVLIESSLSFLGLGVQPPTPTWGNMLADARSFLTTNSALVILPGLLITLTVFCLYVIGNRHDRLA